jgi:hypothetical protein
LRRKAKFEHLPTTSAPMPSTCINPHYEPRNAAKGDQEIFKFETSALPGLTPDYGYANLKSIIYLIENQKAQIGDIDCLIVSTRLGKGLSKMLPLMPITKI